ncbi:MAG: hypothetical protein JWO10_1047, partial [Microbacteriaceae bacterium]|nr:hypothetical protein [Microbacteriaceae bacterium]
EPAAATSESDGRFADAMAEFDALSSPGGSPQAANVPLPAAVAPEVFDRPIAFDQPSAFDQLFAVPTPAPLEAPIALDAQPEPAAAEPATVAEIIFPPKQQAEYTPPQEPGIYTPPVGHWSTQAGIDDDEQFQENTLTRNIGATSGAITANALVIPSLPSEDALRPFGSTGEILITGSINLPRGLGSTGSMNSGRYDHSDVDAFLSATDGEDSSPDSAPVRATSAISTHTSSQGVIGASKPKNSRLPMVLIATAAVMAVGVVLLVVAGMIFKIF